MPNYFDEIDVLPTYDRQNVINARNKRRQRKIWNPRNVSLILPGTYIFREFPFPRSHNDRYERLELGHTELFTQSRAWNNLLSKAAHISGQST